jgi:isoamylase
VEVHLRNDAAETVIELTGDPGEPLPGPVRERVLAQAGPGQRLLLDLSRLGPLSPAGLRTLLLLLRRIKAAGGTVLASRPPDELLRLADAAGFLVVSRHSSRARSRAPSSAARVLTGNDEVVLPCIDVHPSHYHAGFAIRPGQPTPFGASLVPRGVNFSIYSRHARSCTLVLFPPGVEEPLAEIPFPPSFRIGDVFAMTVLGVDPDGIEYGFRVDGPSAPRRGHRFDGSKVLLDPAARAVSARPSWGTGPTPLRPRGCLVPEDFDWEGDRPLHLPFEDLIIYEMHVRGFTRSPSSGVRHPGTYAGLREKIPYLQSLGVNCVELMPVFEFDELENPRRHPMTGERLLNYWGYSTLSFYAPKAGYAATGPLGLQVDEFKSLVKELHQAGIEVILDVVFNHTAEGGEDGPTLSFRGLDNCTWYMLTPDGHYLNFSGCGNTLNCNHPVVRNFVLDCLRYWVSEYHIDGFRFDLASILGRDPSGTPLNNPPLLEALALDPVLSSTRLIAEAWDAGGLYQVGRFPAYGRWAEWNGHYRDCLRKFLKGDPGQLQEVAQRLIGSPDLYHDRGPWASVNFITCHDGFTLLDLVSYNHKHNEANGEGNRDGWDGNLSWNCGVEGPTNDPGIQALRRRQVKNALTMLLVSQGIPMLLMGDEFGRTQQGNNNAYCHDSPLTWMDWTLIERNAELLRYCRHLIAFRKQHPALRQPLHFGKAGDRRDAGPTAFHEVTWHGTRPWHPDWSATARPTLAFQLRSGSGSGLEDIVYVLLNMHWEWQQFGLPTPPHGRRWHVFANTGMASPEDVWEPGQEPDLADQGRFLLLGRSVAVLVALGH